ncbi:hypothetical protein V1288_000451 [Bradyrhizobium sp. AZCC 2176]
MLPIPVGRAKAMKPTDLSVAKLDAQVCKHHFLAMFQ